MTNESQGAGQESTAGRSKLPGTLVILGGVVLLAALATLVLPRGEFERVEKVFGVLVPHQVAAGEELEDLARAAGAPLDLGLDQVLDAETRDPVEALVPGASVLVRKPGLRRTSIVAGTYQRLADADPRGLGEKLAVAGRSVALAPIRGFEDRADVIGFVLLIGAAFGILLSTGAMDRALVRAVTLLGEGQLRLAVIPVSMILFSLGGAVFGMGESTIAFVLVTIPLSIRMGYDTVTGVCMCYLASQVGFAGAFFNPFTIGIGQSIAELPTLSGLGFRIVTWFLATGVAITFVALHASRVRRDPHRSPTFELDRSWRERLEAGAATENSPLTPGEWGVVLIMLGTLVFSGVGVAVWGWYIPEMAALFVVAGILGGFVGGLGPSRVAEEFTKGARSMVEPALIIALSAGILRVLQDGQVLDTVLSSLAAPLEHLAPTLAANLIMVGQAVVNFFVPSGSGQAALTMPVMTPLCDILGLDRQVGVLAFQFGDGFGNMLIPTSAVLMGVLGAARVPWSSWVGWAWRLILFLHVLGGLLLVAAIYGPTSWMRWPAS